MTYETGKKQHPPLRLVYKAPEQATHETFLKQQLQLLWKDLSIDDLHEALSLAHFNSSINDIYQATRQSLEQYAKQKNALKDTQTSTSGIDTITYTFLPASSREIHIFSSTPAAIPEEDYLLEIYVLHGTKLIRSVAASGKGKDPLQPIIGLNATPRGVVQPTIPLQQRLQNIMDLQSHHIFKGI